MKHRKTYASMIGCLLLACGSGEETGSALDTSAGGDGSQNIDGTGGDDSRSTDGTGAADDGESSSTGARSGRGNPSGGGATGGASTGGAASGGSASGGASTGGTGGGSFDCEGALNDINALVQSARACKTGGEETCTKTLYPPCGCPTPVSYQNAAEIAAANAAIATYQSEGCSCGLIPACAYWETAECQAGGAGGSCVPTSF